MRYTLTPEEIGRIQDRIAALPYGPSYLDDPVMSQSTSKWGVPHLDALRVINIDDLPLERFFDSDNIPTDTHPVFASLAPYIVAPSVDQLRAFADHAAGLLTNPFSELFGGLAELVTARSSNFPGTKDHKGDPSSEDGLLASSDEDKPEQVARAGIAGLLTPILAQPFTTLRNDVQLGWTYSDCRTYVYIGSSGKATSLSDGGIVINSKGTYTKSNRIGKYPVVNVEVKRRHAGGVKHGSGDAGAYVPRLLAQEVGEMLGQAMAHCDQVYDRKWRDQEAWIITMHGTQLRFVTAYFTRDYLRCVNSPSMPPSEQLVVFRSAPIDLKMRDERLTALRAVIALIEYLRLGNPQIALLQHVLKKV